MPFLFLNSEVSELRRSLHIYVGPNALDEIHLRPPARNDDEASFLRLTNWCYVLLHEAGKTSIDYLLNLPSKGGRADRNLREVLTSVHSLRTFCVHNLSFTDREVKLSRRAHNWLREKKWN